MADNDDAFKTHDELEQRQVSDHTKNRGLLFQTFHQQTSSYHPEAISSSSSEISVSRRWLLSGIFLLGLAILTWAYFGSLTIEINGRGIFMHKKKGFAIQAVQEGIVQNIAVKPQQEIQANDLIAVIYDPKEQLKLQIAEKYVITLQENLKTLQSKIDREAEALRKSILDEIAAKELTIKEKTDNVEKLKKDLGEKHEVFQKKLISIDQLRAAEAALSQENIEIESLKGVIQGLQAKLHKAYRTDEIKRGLNEIFQAEMVRDLQKHSLEIAEIFSPIPGEVLEVFINLDDRVKVGQLIVWLDTLNAPDNPLIVYGYFPIQQSKRIYPGQDVWIKLPSKKIKGKIVSVSQYAVSSDYLLRNYHSKTLGTYLKSGADEVIEAIIVPEIPINKDSNEVGLNKVSSGTVVEVDVVTARVRPLYYLLPL